MTLQYLRTIVINKLEVQIEATKTLAICWTRKFENKKAKEINLEFDFQYRDENKAFSICIQCSSVYIRCICLNRQCQ
jgi:hypothetical protein